MTNIPLILETALLLLLAYLAGCIIGYGCRRAVYAGRGTRIMAAPIATIPAVAEPQPVRPPRPRTNAARLAAASEELPPPPVLKPVPAISAAPAPETKTRPPRKPRAKPAKLDPKPAALLAPRNGQADNLKQIKGIGPKIEVSLNAFGVYHLDQIAAWSNANIDWVDSQLAFKGRIRRERWVEQATALSPTKG